MGFDRATVQFLANAQSKLGVSFDRVLTIGRQSLHVSAGELQSVLAGNQIPCTAAEAQRMMTAAQGYCEPLLEKLGAGEIQSLDVSRYEGASIIHDMNQPIGGEYHGRFSLVIDGGSLEHVFNYPVAIRNCMEAVAEGGHFLTIAPANNLMGHGFYQISPELLFRVLGPDNGFEISRMIIYEHPWRSTWYEVNDPEQVRSRVELTNSRPAYLIACARRTRLVPMFVKTPQQSDYSHLWRSSEGEATAAPDPPPAWKRRVPKWAVQLYWRVRPFRPRYYSKGPPGLSD